MAEKFRYTSPGAFDIVYTIDENEFNGVTKLQMKVIDIRPAHQYESCLCNHYLEELTFLVSETSYFTI